MDLFILDVLNFLWSEDPHAEMCYSAEASRREPATQWGSYWKQIIGFMDVLSSQPVSSSQGNVDLPLLDLHYKANLWNYRKAESHFLGVKMVTKQKPDIFLKVKKKAFRLWGTRTCRKCNSQWTQVFRKTPGAWRNFPHSWNGEFWKNQEYHPIRISSAYYRLINSFVKNKVSRNTKLKRV